jgi:hypothetical protein
MSDHKGGFLVAYTEWTFQVKPAGWLKSSLKERYLLRFGDVAIIVERDIL